MLTRGGLPSARRGQAMMELAAGMFALSLVVSALCLFAVYIVNSLRVQNSLRSSSPQNNVRIEVGDFAERYFTGKPYLKMDERAVMPPTEVLK